MGAFRTQALVLLALSLLLLQPEGSVAHPHGQVLRLKDRAVISFESMIEELKGATYVFVGETHDDEWHHKTQLTVIKALDNAGGPMAVGLEMFLARDQKKLNEWVQGEMEKRDFLSLYYENWKMPWPLYRDIFLYLRDRDIGMLGLNVPKEITSKVAEQGFDSLNREELAQLPPGLSCDVDEDYMGYIRQVHRAHGRSGSSFVYFCEAQILWDKAMAWYLLDYAGRNPSRTVVVLAGLAHALKRGAPEQIRRLEVDAPKSFKVVLPLSPDIPLAALTHDLADYVVLN
jgi:uncharacterized iron-regulated protein